MISIDAPICTEVLGDRKVYKVRGAPFEVPLRFSVLGVLGHGSYGTVCAVVDDITGRKYAVKKMTMLQEDDRAELCLRELEVLGFAQHENLLSLETIFPARADADAIDSVYCAMPLLLTTLSTVLRSRQPLEENQRQYFAYQLIRGLHYMHTAGIVHGDLKPNNLMVEVNCTLKIGDFGLAQLLNGGHPLLRYIVTPGYRAPELLVRNTSYGPEVDIWAAGCIVAELYKRRRFFTYFESREEMLAEVAAGFGKLPADVVQHEAGRQMLKRVSGERTTSLKRMLPELSVSPDPKVAQDFIRRMLTVDPRKRATAAELLRHPYLANYVEPSDLLPAPSVLLGTRVGSSSEALRAIRRLVDEHNPPAKPEPVAPSPAVVGPRLSLAMRHMSAACRERARSIAQVHRLAARFAQRQLKACRAARDQKRHVWSPHAWSR